MTVPKAPNFASAARASRRNNDLQLSTAGPLTERRKIITSEPVTPSLFTLQRARVRCASALNKGETHRLDDPYTPGPKYIPPEKVVQKGLVNHNTGFSTCYKQQRSLSTPFLISIVAGRGGDAVNDKMF